MTRMADNDKKPKKTGSRSKRLAAALRENLRRRKAQERRRGAESAPGEPTRPGPVPSNDKNR